MPPRSATRRRPASPDGKALAGVVALGCALFGPGLLGQWPILRDLPGFLLPSRAMWRQAVLEGRLPQWNPLVGLGVATTGAPVHGVFYPPHLLLLFAEAVRSLPALMALHAIVAGVGAYALARSARCSPVASAVAGVAWMLGGYSVSMWGNGEKVLSEAWVPLAAAAMVMHARAPRLLSPWLASAAAALGLTALAGDPFLWLDALALAVPLGWAAARGEVGPRQAALRALSRPAAAVGLALLLAAPALLPAWLMRGDTRRAADLALDVSELWSMHPARLLELVSPGALGDPMKIADYPGARLAGGRPSESLPWALSIYGGAACACLPWLAGRGRATYALVASAALGLLASLGKYTPAHALLRQIVVPMRWMRYPEKHALVVLLALGVLAALGVDRALARRAPPWRALAAMGALGAVAIAAAPADLRAPTLWGLLHGAAGAAATVLALWLAARRPRAAPLVVLAVALDVGLATRPLLPWSDEDLHEPPDPAARILAEPTPTPPRMLRPHRGALTLESLPGNLASLWGIDSLPGHDPARSVRLDRLAGRLGGPQTVKLSRILRFDWALSPVDEKPDGSARWELRGGDPLPRAWVVGRAVVADDDEALARIAQDGFDPEREASVAPSGTARALSSGAGGACEVTRFAAEQVELSCTSSGEALVVLAEAPGPGWTATVDGASAPIERADLALRGVWVGAGTHRVRFDFSTPGLAVALALAVAGAALTGWLARRTCRAPA